MFVCCDVRSVSKEFTDSVKLITKAELCHMDVNAVETLMCEPIKWHSKALKEENPVMRLISDSGSFGSTLTQLSRLGWKVIIFHPPNTLSSFLDYADLAIPLPVCDKLVKIADFGLSSEDTVYQMDPHKRVPIRWLAPEILKTAIYSQKTDVFSYGIMYWKICNNGVEPYPEMTVTEVNQNVKEGYRMELPPSVNMKML